MTVVQALLEAFAATAKVPLDCGLQSPGGEGCSNEALGAPEATFEGSLPRPTVLDPRPMEKLCHPLAAGALCAFAFVGAQVSRFVILQGAGAADPLGFFGLDSFYSSFDQHTYSANLYQSLDFVGEERTARLFTRIPKLRFRELLTVPSGHHR